MATTTTDSILAVSIAKVLEKAILRGLSPALAEQFNLDEDKVEEFLRKYLNAPEKPMSKKASKKISICSTCSERMVMDTDGLEPTDVYGKGKKMHILCEDGTQEPVICAGRGKGTKYYTERFIRGKLECDGTGIVDGWLFSLNGNILVKGLPGVETTSPKSLKKDQNPLTVKKDEDGDFIFVNTKFVSKNHRTKLVVAKKVNGKRVKLSKDDIVECQARGLTIDKDCRPAESDSDEDSE